MKRLVVSYGDNTLFDDYVSEFVFSDGPGGVRAEGRFKPPAVERPAPSGGGLLGALTSAAAASRKDPTP